MQVPLKVAFEGVEVSEVVRNACWREAETLERWFQPITGCQVTVSAPHAHRREGKEFDLRVQVTAADQVIVVDHQAPDLHTDAYALLEVREVFDRVRRRLRRLGQEADRATRSGEAAGG